MNFKYGMKLCILFLIVEKETQHRTTTSCLILSIALGISRFLTFPLLFVSS